MIFLPVDLFSPYIQGRENAIDRNWNDLNQANKVEEGWQSNDARQLNNWFAQDTYGDRLSSSNASGRIDQNKALGTDLNAQLAVAGQPGAMAQVQSLSGYQQALNNATQPYIAPMAQNNAMFSYGQSVDAAAQGTAAVNNAPAFRNQAAQNTVAAANLQGQSIQNTADLMPIQQQTQRGNLELQNAVNQQLLQNPQALLPQQQPMAGQPQVGQVPVGQPAGVPQAAAPQAVAPGMTPAMRDAQVYSQAAGLPVGRTVQANIGGSTVTIGRDKNGVFTVENGQQRYVIPAGQSVNTNTTFSWGGLK
jgi:hypothetical protein